MPRETLGRRRFLCVTASTAAGLVPWGCGARPSGPAQPAAGPAPQSSASPTASPLSRTTTSLPDPHAMARTLLATPRDDVPTLALDWHAHGATANDLLRVAMLAGVAEIDPSPIGGKVHAIMMVTSAVEATRRMEGPTALMPALFNLDRVKHSQARDEDEGDWSMPEAPAPEPAPVAVGLESLERAMDAWELPAADRAITALHGQVEPAVLFESLWPWAARDFRVIGHKAIYAAQTYRALDVLGWQYGRDALRSLVFGVLDQNPYDSATRRETKAILGLFDTNRERRAQLPEGWHGGAADPAASFRLCARLRDSDPDEAAAAVVHTSQAGFGGPALWDGLRLRAFELLMQGPSIAGVHPVTAVNALHRAAMVTTNDATRRLMPLQAASWLSLFAPLLGARPSARADPRTIDALRDDVERSDRAADPFAVDDPTEAGRRAFVEVHSAGPDAFARRSLDVLIRKADQDHDYKLAIAALEEIDAAHPECRPYLASACLRYLPLEPQEDGPVYRAVHDRLQSG